MAEEFTPKDWKNANEDGTGDHSTPTDAPAIEDLEIRLANYADLRTQFAKADKWSTE